MRTLFVTVSDDRSGRKGGKYSQTQNEALQLFQSHPEFGLTEFAFWKWQDILSTEFYRNNKMMLNHIEPDMNGRCYKPFVVSEGLKSLAEGDFLIYNDVSPELWTYRPSINVSRLSLNVIRELCVSSGCILSATASLYGKVEDHTHENLTMERCINRMGMQSYKYSLQHAGGFLVLQKNQKTSKFVQEWLYYNLIDECASLGPVTGLSHEHKYWAEEQTLGYGKFGHRHDQSISGLLVNALGNKLIKNTHGYCFLNFCNKGTDYEFIDSNQPKLPYKLIGDGEKAAR
jgi:hypothetical protein